MNPYQLFSQFGISRSVYELALSASEQMMNFNRSIDSIAEARQLGVLQAFHNARISESSFNYKSGYGYDDLGREQIEEIYAETMQAESALVRIQFSSGTHVLATCLRALLHRDDDVLIVSGLPYDTILPSFGKIRLLNSAGEKDEIFQYSESRQTLAANGVSVRAVELTKQGQLDLGQIETALLPETRMLYVQKSRGYSSRRALLSEEIADLKTLVDRLAPGCIIMVDNCYGEFMENLEPTAYGADLIAGSLIKNPGAGIAPSGGYVCGREDLLQEIAEAMTAVGVGAEIGPSLGFNREILAGIYFAPQVVAAATAGAVFAALLFQKAGFSVAPLPEEIRGDLVQTIQMDNADQLTAFCEAIQAAAPIDAHFSPIPSEMPGYDCDIIMASGSFIQGSSIELSADGPLRPPFTAFLQGGLNFHNARLGAMLALERVQSL
ncbi:MAG: aminotransferase class V-fold PLP-dependent enzyme [Fastidiosipila sp.]|nr:aminotransferase class V-fold PLP-dependent enzyme [Fastidiosipila sp.]